MALGLALDQLRDMVWVFDLRALVVTAQMRYDDLLTIKNPDPLRIGHHGMRFAHLRVRHRIVVQIKAHIWGLAHRHRQSFVRHVGISRQREQTRLLLSKGVSNILSELA